MQPMAHDGQRVATAERSTSELVTQFSGQMSHLVRAEIKLARLEMARKGKEAGKGAGMLGGSGLIALYGAGCLIACAIIAISGAVAAWLAALIIGAALLAVAGIGALTGRRRLRRAVPPVPEQAAGNVRADVEEIREKAHR